MPKGKRFWFHRPRDSLSLGVERASLVLRDAVARTPPSDRENFLSGGDNERDRLIRVEYELDLVLDQHA